MTEGFHHRLRRALLPVTGVLLVAFQWWPMIAAYPRTPEFDGRYAFQQFEIAKASLRLYGEVSLWNPFDCRGIPMWDFPESMTGSPLFFATVYLDTLPTLYVWNLFHAIAGFFSMSIFLRRGLRLSQRACFVGSAFWSVGAWHVIQCAGNHETFVPFFLAPLLVHLWRESELRRDAAVLGGLVVAWMIYAGGTYAVPFSAILLGIETCTRLRSRARVGRIAMAGAIVGVVVVTVAASRLLPLLDQFSQHRRELPPDSDHLLRGSTLFAMFFDRGPADPLGRGLAGQQYGFDEYVIYFGPFGVVAALLGSMIAWRKHRWTVFVVLVLTVLALGHFASWAPWAVLQRHVFPFTSLRVPSRFILFIALFLCVWIALLVEHAETMVAEWTANAALRRWLPIAATLIATLGVADSAEWGRSVVARRFTGAPRAEVAASPRFFYGLDAEQDPDFINHPRQNHAYEYCRATSFAFHPNAPIWTGDAPQARAAGADATILDVVRTHNTFDIEVDATAHALIRLNSAYDRGWQTNFGEIEADGELLAVRVPPGKHRVHVNYWPRTLTAGLLLSALATTACAAFLVCAKFRRRTMAAISGQ